MVGKITREKKKKSKHIWEEKAHKEQTLFLKLKLIYDLKKEN